jgi:hypothetical protein
MCGRKGESAMKSFVIVHQNDARVVGPFASAEAAEDWARRTPNVLFGSEEELEHVSELEGVR